MADLHRDRLTLGATLVGGVCVAAFAAILGTMLWSPAVPKPRGAGQAGLQETMAVTTPAQPTRDNDRIVAVPGDAGSAAPASQNPAGAKIAAATPPAPPVTSTGSITASTTFPGNSRNGRNAGTKNSAGDADGQRGLVILQIGDSHTSADFFTGEVRRRLQQRYGNGGVGYLTAGKPHIGVRSSALKVTVSGGWTYHAIQHSDNIAEFWLSGFNVVATASGETLSFASDNPVPFDSIEIEALRQPGGGAIDISLDGTVKSSVDLDGKAAEPVVLRLRPDGAANDHVRQIEIRTRKEGTVSIASVAVYNKQSGVSYNNIGYPGATIDLLNKFDVNLMADDLRRLDPQIVVLSFGTNEASKPNLDPVRYQQNYEKVIDKITAALPKAKIVLIGPPDGEERTAHCQGKPAQEAVCHPSDATPAASATSASSEAGCEWRTLPKLEMVRGVERKIAERRGFTYWNWASIMPHDCGAHLWATASPPLMAPDHVHFTIAGYNKGAEQFIDTTLIPVIEKLQVRPNIAANN